MLPVVLFILIVVGTLFVGGALGYSTWCIRQRYLASDAARNDIEMQGLPSEHQRQAIMMEGNIPEGKHTLQFLSSRAVGSERLFMSGALGGLARPEAAMTRRNENDARIEGVSPYRGHDMGEMGYAGFEPDRNAWITGTTLGTGGDEQTTQRLGRNLTLKPAQTISPYNRTSVETQDSANDNDTSEVDCKGESMEGVELSPEEQRKTKEERDRERKERAISEASAKLEGTWEGYVDPDGAVGAFAKLFS